MALNWLHKKRDDGTEMSSCPECESEVDEELTYCTVCGYDIVKQAKTDVSQPRLP